MTTKQAIRTVLKDTEKFIISDDNGVKWYCPDGYLATNDNIYSQYTPKKSQLDKIDQFSNVNNQPKMQFVFNKVNQGDYVQVQHIGDVQDIGTITLFSEQQEVIVKNKYLQLIQVLYPDSQLEIDTAHWYSPVKVIKDNKLVALLMPIHK